MIVISLSGIIAFLVGVFAGILIAALLHAAANNWDD